MTSRRLMAAEKVLLAVGLIALAQMAVSWLLPRSTYDFTAYCGLLTAQQLLFYGLPALILRTEKRNPTPRLTEEKEGPGFGRLTGVASAAVLHQGALALLTLVLGQWLAYLGLSVTETRTPLPASEQEWLMALGAFCLLPALCEEGFFRGRVLAGLKNNFSTAASLMISGGVFALMHGQLAALPAHLAVGLMLGVLCLKDGLLSAVVYHLFFNAASLALSHWETLTGWQGWLMGHPPLLLALLGLLLLLGGAAGWGLSRKLKLKENLAPRRCWWWALGVGLLLLPRYLMELLPR